MCLLPWSSAQRRHLESSNGFPERRTAAVPPHCLSAAISRPIAEGTGDQLAVAFVNHREVVCEIALNADPLPRSCILSSDGNHNHSVKELGIILQSGRNRLRPTAGSCNGSSFVYQFAHSFQKTLKSSFRMPRGNALL